MNSFDKGHEFEKDVLKILYTTNPYKITHYDGGSDRGRDIIINYMIDSTLYEVIVQCKCYSNSIKIEDISSSLDWVKVHRPALFYLWVKPYLTSSTKDYLESFSKEYNIIVDYEEAVNIERYLDELSVKNSEILKNLKERIINNINKNTALLPSRFSEEDCYLVDRVIAQEELKDNIFHAFFVQGVSGCGKTQLLKKVALYYTNQKRHIFWFTFHTSTSDIQLKTFWTSLGIFFYVEYNNYKLNSYFEKFGYHSTTILKEMVISLLKEHSIFMIIDDVHKCSFDNCELRDFFELIIEKELATIFFAGWFNIFDSKPFIQTKLKKVSLDGLEWKDLDTIIKHNTGESKPSIAKKIADEYNGLPSFASIVHSNTVEEDFCTDKTFLFSLVTYLSEDEKVVLFSFVHSSEPLPKLLFCIAGYERAFDTLNQKNLIERQEQKYIIHDKYNNLLKEYPLSYSLAQKIISIFQEESKENIHAIFDIAMIDYQLKQYETAIGIINNNFSKLLHSVSAYEILNYYQLIEKAFPASYNPREVLLNKAILLERCENYELSLFYVELLKYSIAEKNNDWEKIIYLEMRCYYFRNEYDKIINLVTLYSEQLKHSSNSILAQTFLLVGRIYYIRGQTDEALFYYLLSYDYSLKSQDKILIAKTIHRIAMIELKKGYILQSKETFENLLTNDELLSLKRKSYIYYRLAECDYKLGDYEAASKNNLISLNLKQSISNKRGKIFCHRLSAKIAMKTGDYVVAEHEINLALSLAQELKIHKEEMSCAIIKINQLMLTKESVPDNCRKSVESYVDIAQTEKNIYLLTQLMNSVKDIYPDIFHEIKIKIDSISQELEMEASNNIRPWAEIITPNSRKLYYECIHGNSIGKKMLIQSELMRL